MKPILFAALAGVTLIITFVLYPRSEEVSAPTHTTPVGPVGALTTSARAANSRHFTAPVAGFGWQVGRSYRYGLVYDTTEKFQSETVGSLGGTVGLDADLTVTAVAPLPNGGLRTRWTLDAVRRGQVYAFGRPAALDPSSLEGGVEVDLGATGLAERIRLPESTPPLARNALHSLVLEIAMDLRPGARWTSVELGLVGEGELRYEREEGDVRRWRTGYRHLRALPVVAGEGPTVDVDSALTAHFESGFLVVLDGREQVDAASPRGTFQSGRTLRLTWVETTAAVLADLGPSEERVVGDLSVGAAADRRALTARVGGLDAATLFAMVMAFDAAGQAPEHLRFLWQATGLLALEPERCADLALSLLDPATGPKGRLLGLDLLASTGTPEAQAALRSVIRGLAEVSMEEVSRLALLQQPEPESLALAEELATTTTGSVRGTARLAAGAMAGFLSSADPEATAGVLARLGAELGAATADSDQVELVRALGNLGGTEILGHITALAGSPSLDVRLAVADALRKLDTPDADALLIRLLADEAPRVQAKALTALGAQPRTDAVAAGVAAFVATGALAPENEGAALQFAAREPLDPSLARAVAEHVLSRTEDSGVRAAAEGLLAIVAGRG